jgi:hypothetical protein
MVRRIRVRHLIEVLAEAYLRLEAYSSRLRAEVRDAACSHVWRSRYVHLNWGTTTLHYFDSVV